MCDEFTTADNDALLGTVTSAVTRRSFASLAGAAGIAMLLPAPANAKPVSGKDVTIAKPDGSCDAYFVAPATGEAPGVLI